MSDDRKRLRVRNITVAIGVGTVFTGATFGLYCFLKERNRAQIYHQTYEKHEDDSSNEEDCTDPCKLEMCAICHDTMTVDCTTISICKHSFHKQCLKEWKRINRTCPMCRTEI